MKSPPRIIFSSESLRATYPHLRQVPLAEDFTCSRRLAYRRMGSSNSSGQDDGGSMSNACSKIMFWTSNGSDSKVTPISLIIEARR